MKRPRNIGSKCASNSPSNIGRNTSIGACLSLVLYLGVGLAVATAESPNTLPALLPANNINNVYATGAPANVPAMAVLGNFTVSATGAATYSIPIAVPPGTNAMVPSLSLDYASSGGDGIVGLGWSVGGLPSISRCPETVAQDAVHGGVNYDANDRYCFDGQRLILVSGTSYGAPNSVYRTEIDSFSEFIAHGTQGNGPAWFEVHNKSGQVLEFGNPTNANGNASNAQILAKGTSTVATWALNQIEDSKSNYIAVTYTDDTANGQYYPERIDYTGNQNADTSTYNSVQFFYTNRPASDIVPTYQAGSLSQTTVLLSDIKTFTGSSLVTDYRLSYNPGSAGLEHDQLNEITQCDALGNCLAPTTLTWQGGNGLPALTSYPQTFPTFPGGGLIGMVAGDFNGDGLTDLYCPDGSAIWSGTLSGTSFTSSGITSTSSIGLCTHFFSVVDLNGDGFSDLFFMGIDVTSSVINNQSGVLTQITSPSCSYFNCSEQAEIVGGDFNGDGRTDLWDAYTPGTLQTYYSNGSTVGAHGTFIAGEAFTVSGITRTFPGDFDGDGCTDFLIQTTGVGEIAYSCQPATATATPPALLNTFPTVTLPSGDVVSTQMVVGDFNGDGKEDILFVPPTGAGTLFLSTGTGFVASSFSVPSTWGQYTIVTGDWNGDGKTDIAVIADGAPGHLGVGTSHQIWLSTGTGFVEETTIANTNPANTAVTATAADWNSDGASDLWLKQSSGNVEYLFSYKPELMTTINNGIGASTTIVYDKINNAAIYTKGSGSTYPTQDVDGALYVVSQTSMSNGIGGANATSYTYGGAKADLSGRGPLGFSQIKSTDPLGVVTTTNYQTAFPYTGFIASQTVASGSVTLRSTVNTYASLNEGGSTPGSAFYFVSLQQSVVSGADLNGSVLPQTTTSYAYDSYGNTLTQSACVSVSPPTCSSTSTTTNTYNNNTTNWWFQLLTSQTQNVVGSSNLTRHMSNSYDATYGLVAQSVLEPGNSALSYTTAYGYDAFGNQTSSTISGAGIATRVSGRAFDARGEFATQVTNALSQSGSLTFSPSFGTITSAEDPNNLTRTTAYDTFGRQTTDRKPDGTQTSTSYSYCSGINGGTASCPTFGAYVVLTMPESPPASQNGPQTATYYDALGRVVASETQGFNGSWINTATQYDAYGRVSQTSRPYFVSGGTQYWAHFAFDVLNRVTQVTFPDTSIKTYSYNGLTTSVTNANSQTTTTLKNAQGLVASRTDANNKTTSFVYDAFGNPTTVTDSAGNVVQNTFDLWGRNTATIDPDLGSWSFVYDVLSELTSETDAKSQTTSFTYDLLGRPTQRVETDMTANWVWDTASMGIGSLASACTGVGCTSPSNSSYFRALTYDGFGRPWTTTLTIGGANYVYTTTYNPTNGAIAAVTYPSSLAVSYSYTSLGYLASLTDASSGIAMWTANTRDAELHLTQALAGNGIVTNQNFNAATGRISAIQAGSGSTIANFSYGFDPLGNLTTRSDANEGINEVFCYDVLNRLKGSATGTSGATPSSCTSSGTNIATKTMGYDNLGDITSKSDVGTYSYPATGAARPHAVSGITGTVNGVTNPTYTYDADGNMTAGAGRTVTYASFNMATNVVDGASAIGFTYDSEHGRITQTSSAGVTTYLNDAASGSMSEAFLSGSTTTWRDYVVADGQIVALRQAVPAGTPTNWGAANWGSFSWSGLAATLSYFNGDYLGSTSVLTNAVGTATEHDSYDAWGKRRNPNGTDNTACSVTSQTTRGFTGQEMLDSICQIDLNARIYDPTIARILTADPIIPYPMNGQSYNRYSYVNNRPLSRTDPSGYDDNGLTQGFPMDWLDEDIIEGDISGGGLSSTAPPPPCDSNYEENGITTVVACAPRWSPPPLQVPISPPPPVPALVPIPLASLTPTVSPRSNSNCKSAAWQNYVDQHTPDAKTLAQMLRNGSNAQEFLALSSVETDWGTSNGANLANNYFGVHNKGTQAYSGATGSYVTSGHAGVVGTLVPGFVPPNPQGSPQQVMAAFPQSSGFLDSGSVVANSLLKLGSADYSDPSNFFNAIRNNGWAQKIGKLDYLSTMLDRYRDVSACSR